MSVNFNVLQGQTFSRVYKCGEKIVFEKNGMIKYTLEHMQDCCEDVYIEDICGDLSSLENAEITFAEESYHDGNSSDCMSSTWSFYKLATIKGWVDIRFFGTSNGNYSESAGLEEYEYSSIDTEETGLFYTYDLGYRIKYKNKQHLLTLENIQLENNVLKYSSFDIDFESMWLKIRLSFTENCKEKAIEIADNFIERMKNDKGQLKDDLIKSVEEDILLGAY